MKIRENSVLPICAMRYALGRHTYMPSEVIKELIPLLTKLEDSDIKVMLEDIAKHLDGCKKNGSWSIDDYDWQRFYEALERERKRRDGLHRD